MIKFFSKIIDRILVVICALVFSQAPVFIQQYQMNLLGHVDELHLQVNAMKWAAEHNGKNLEQFIGKFMRSDDIDFFHQGEIMSSMISRYDSLSEALKALKNATIVTKPYYFFKYYNHEIAKSTANAFVFSLPLNLEGLTYAFIGILFGMMTFAAIQGIFRIITRARAQA